MSKIILKGCITLILINIITNVSPSSAQNVLFDFDNAPLHSSLPISQTVNGITAYFSATGDGFSIQSADAQGFTPQGFAGYVIYPNSINLSDLLIRFDRTLTDFSIMYACQELGCDDAATMRVTAYQAKTLVGTNTKTTGHPGTWPVDTLRCTFQQGFDSVVVHYDSKPPTCKDYGTIFMADNMRVATLVTSGILDQNISIEGVTISNPSSNSATISFTLLKSENIDIKIFDITGRLIKTLFTGPLNTGYHQINWDLNDNTIKSGVYFLNLRTGNYRQSYKMLVQK